MADPVIRLDTSKPYSECHGERTPSDPHYGVAFWQGQLFKGERVNLPFDARGLLVADDGKTQPFDGLDVENKPVKYLPLYNEAMRELVKVKKEKLAKGAKAAAEDADAGGTEGGDGDEGGGDQLDDVNFVAWLRGEAQYQPHLLRAAAKKRYSKNYAKIPELVADLVLDEKIVPEDQVCLALRKHLPA